MREGKEELRDKEEETESPSSIVRLTGRDRELMGHVATARYLTLPQLKRIVFVRALNGGKRKAGASGKEGDRKSTRLNSSHGYISYAVFCLKKKKKDKTKTKSRQ